MPIAPIEGWVMDMDGRMIPGTPRPIPADGDDYTYKPPLIPAQWISLEEHNALVEMVCAQRACLAGMMEIQDSTLDVVNALTERVIALEKRLGDMVQP